MVLAQSLAATPIITGVSEFGGDGETTDTIAAQWTGISFPCSVVNEPVLGLAVGANYTVGLLQEDAPAYVDRAHQWNGATALLPLPAYLVGGEYVMAGNDNKDNATYRLEITLSEPANVYLLVDNRNGDANAADPPNLNVAMSWLLTDGWVPVRTGYNRTADPLRPDEVGVDEIDSAAGTGGGVGPGQGINNYSSVYRKVLPAGTFTVYQDGAGGNMYGVVVKAQAPDDPPWISDLTPANGELLANPTAGLSFHAQTIAPNTIASIQLVLNSSDVTASAVISPPSADRTVTFNAIQGNTFHAGQIVVTDNNGRSITYDFSFDTLGAGGVVIETEDYNYGLSGTLPVVGFCPGDPYPTPGSGGGFQDNPPPSGFPPGSFFPVNGNGVGYLDLVSVSGVDYSDTSTTVGCAGTVCPNNYRTCTPVGVRRSTDLVRQKYVPDNLRDWSLELHQMQAGEWLNYTRTFPTANYLVYLRTRCTAAQKLTLNRVNGGSTQPGQSTTPLGEFQVPVTTGYEYVPLRDIEGSAPLVLSLDGIQTLRLSAQAAADNVFPNFLVFVPTSDSPTTLGPVVTVRQPAAGAGASVYTAIGATIVNRDLAVDVSMVQLALDGTDLTSSSSRTPTAEGATISYLPPARLKYNTLYTVTVTYSDLAANVYVTEWTFTTTGAPFIQEANGRVVMEAEHYARNLPDTGGYSWETTNVFNYSGETAMLVRTAAGNDGQPDPGNAAMDYDILFNRSGRHFVWVRAAVEPAATGGDTDSVWPTLDGVRDGTANQSSLTGWSGNTAAFGWWNERQDDLAAGEYYPARLTLNVLTAGLHTLQIYEREDGAVMDKIVVTDDPNFTPTGFGPPESPLVGDPLITISSPTDGAGFPMSANVPITATVTVGDNPIELVEFFVDATKIGEAATSPYTTTWMNAPYGIHTLTASVRDTLGRRTLSPPVSVDIGDVTPPTVVITTPTAGTAFASGADVPITVVATDEAGGSGLALIELYADGVMIASSTTSPLNYTMPAPPDGRYKLLARAYDGRTNRTDSAVALIEVGPVPPYVLFVVGDTNNLNASDIGISNRLVSLGLEVEVVDDLASQTSDADFKDLIFVSSTVTSGSVGSKFTSVGVPLINAEQAIQDDLLMTLNAAVDHGTVAGQTQLNIVNVTHPLAAGLSAGAQTIVRSPDSFNWGLPNANATVVANVTTNASMFLLYVYETGALLIDGLTPAPARRINVPFTDNSFALLNPDGYKLFDAAIFYALGITPPTAVITSPADGAFLNTVDVTINADVTGASGSFLLELFGDGVKLGESTTAPYTFNWTGLADGSHTVFVRVTDDALGALLIDALSPPVTFTVDTLAPMLKYGADGNLPLSQAILHYTEPVSASAATPAIYTITGPLGETLAVNNAQMGMGGSNVVLTTGPQTPGARYLVTVVGAVTDLAGNPLAPNVGSESLAVFYAVGDTDFARIDIGPSTGRAAPGWTQLPNTAAAGGNGANYAATAFTSLTGSGFTLAIDNVNTAGAATGGIDWRDRGDSTSAATLAQVAEDFIKNNGGIIRVTLSGLPAGAYKAVSYHLDPNSSTQSDNIQVSVNGDLQEGVRGNSSVSVAVNNVTDTIIENTAARFQFTADGVNPVLLVFNGITNAAIEDNETPLNGLFLQSAVLPPTPTVTITEPANGQYFAAVAPEITVTANPSPAHPDDVVTLVEFFANGIKIGEAPSVPWSIVWSAVPEGTYTLQAVATDLRGAQGTSPTINIVVDSTPPTLVMPVRANLVAGACTLAVRFSEPVGVSALVQGNYQADQGVTLGPVAAGPDSRTVLIPATGVVGGTVYTLTVNNVADLAGNLIAADSQALFIAAAPLIASVVETGGDNEATDTIVAQWTGNTFVCSIAGEPVPGLLVGQNYTVGRFVEDAPCYADRAHSWNGATTLLPLPWYLLGCDYIMSGNDNKDNASYRLDITVSHPVEAYVLADNRNGDANAGNPPVFTTVMTWMVTDGWQPVLNGANRVGNLLLPDEVGVDEAGNGTGPGGDIQNYSSVYRKWFPAGTFSVYQDGNVGNMYGVVIAAGLPQPELTIELLSDGSVRMTWPGALGRLRQADDVLGTWEDVPGAPFGTYTVTPGEPQKFYRLE